MSNKPLTTEAGYESLRHDELKKLLPSAHWLLDLEKHFYGGKGVKPYPEIGDFTCLLADIRDMATRISELESALTWRDIEKEKPEKRVDHPQWTPWLYVKRKDSYGEWVHGVDRYETVNKYWCKSYHFDWTHWRPITDELGIGEGEVGASNGNQN